MFPFGFGMEDVEAELNEFSAKHMIWSEVLRLRELVKTLENRVDLAVKAKSEDKKPILVVHGIENMSDYEAIHKIWKTYMPTGLTIGMEDKQDLYTLDDRDLAAVGLRRINKNQTYTEVDEYDADIIRCSG